MKSGGIKCNRSEVYHPCTFKGNVARTERADSLSRYRHQVIALFQIRRTYLPTQRVKIDLLILLGIKFQRNRINAVSKMRRGRPVIEYMPQVGVTTATNHLGSPAEESKIRTCSNALFAQRLPETWPASTRIILGSRIEQWRLAAYAPINAGILVIPVFAAERRLCTFLSAHPELFRCQLLTPFFF